MIIPAINTSDFETAAEQIRKAESFLPENGWIHIDVEDGTFVPHTTWGDPEEYASLGTRLATEVHFMVEHPEIAIDPWLAVGVKRVIVHLQAMQNPSLVLETCRHHGAEAMLSFDPTVSVESGLPYIASFPSFQVLTVLPGPSGQEFGEEALLKVQSLRARAATATIEVDGGVNEATAKRAREAGATILVSGSYIFGSPDPKGAYDRLAAVQ